MSSVYGLSMDMDCHFILSLSAASIEIYHTQDGHLKCLGSTSFERDSFESEMAELVAQAKGLASQNSPSNKPVKCNVILPNDHVKYVTLTTPSVTKSEALIALDGATPYAVEDLEVGTRSVKGQSYIAAVAKETLEEAKGFATSHGFAPIAFLAHFDDEDEVVEFVFGQMQPSALALAAPPQKANVAAAAHSTAHIKPKTRRKLPLWLILTLFLILFFILLYTLSNPRANLEDISQGAELTITPDPVLNSLQRDISALSAQSGPQSQANNREVSAAAESNAVTIQAQTSPPFAPEELALLTDALLVEFEGAKITPAKIPWIAPTVNTPKLANHVSLQTQMTPPPAFILRPKQGQDIIAQENSEQISSQDTEAVFANTTENRSAAALPQEQDLELNSLQAQPATNVAQPQFRPSLTAQQSQEQPSSTDSEPLNGEGNNDVNTSVENIANTQENIAEDTLALTDNSISSLEELDDDIRQPTTEGPEDDTSPTQDQDLDVTLPRLATIAPPLRQSLEDASPQQDTPQSEDNFTLASAQAPVMRPKNLVPQVTTTSATQNTTPNDTTQSETSNEADIDSVLSSIIAAAPKDTVTVASSSPPTLRPSNLRVAAQSPAKTKASAQSEQRVSRASTTTQLYNAPGRSGQNATIRKALSGNGSHLIGVYGSSKSRRALVRLSNNNYVKVSVGSDFDGGQVVSISEKAMNYVKNGTTFTLTIPSG